MMSHRAPFLAVCTLFLRVLAWSAPRAADAAGHLYLASSSGSIIQRFRLNDGLPEAKPDKVYLGFGGMVAVAADGTMYATVGSYTPVDIYAFAPGSGRPSRHIHIPNFSRRCGNLEATRLDSIATDAGGNLFAAIDNYFSGVGTRFARTQHAAGPDGGLPCQGVAVFGPTASGRAVPIQAISLDSQTMPGTAVDSMDNLFIADQGEEGVYVFSNAITNPRQTGNLISQYTFEVQSLATDPSGNLFAYLTPWCRTCQGAAINVFPPSVNGYGPPASSIEFEGEPYNSLSGIAVRGKYLYAANNAGSVDVYIALQNGSQYPLFSLPIPNISSIAVGP